MCSRILVYAMDLLRNNDKTAASLNNGDFVEREEEEVEEEEGEMKMKWKWKRKLEVEWKI